MQAKGGAISAADASLLAANEESSEMN